MGVEMTEQEKQLIAGLADRLRNAPPPRIDRDADDLISQTIGRQPDALYILTQTVLIQEMALNQAKAQIEELRQRAGAPQYASQPGGFLPSQSAPAGYAPAYPPQPASSGGFSGFLHQAATTAAGVIAGDLAFEALGSLFGGHRGGGFFGGGSGIMPGSETIVNNYYGDQGGAGGDDSQFADAANQSGDDMSPDIEDDRDSGGDAFDSGGGDDGSGSSDV
jgi:hypothetical protein